MPSARLSNTLQKTEWGYLLKPKRSRLFREAVFSKIVFRDMAQNGDLLGILVFSRPF